MIAKSAQQHGAVAVEIKEGLGVQHHSTLTSSQPAGSLHYSKHHERAAFDPHMFSQERSPRLISPLVSSAQSSAFRYLYLESR